MQKVRCNWFSLYLSGLLVVSPISAAENTPPKQLLLDQVLLGEMRYKFDLVDDSIYRLELIAPDDPEVLAAKVRQALQKKNPTLAFKLLLDLKKQAPDSALYHQTQIDYQLKKPESQQLLQQARLLEKAGHLEESKTKYDALFHGEPPTPELAAEYWLTLSRIPDQQRLSFEKLRNLYDYLKAHNCLTLQQEPNNWQFYLTQRLSDLSMEYNNEVFKAANSQAVSYFLPTPESTWNQNTHELAQRVAQEALVNKARQLRNNGDKIAALAYLKKQTGTIPVRILLADWALEDGKAKEALEYYRSVKTMQPGNVEAALGEIESLLVLGKKPEARQLLLTTYNLDSSDLNIQRRTAVALGTVGDEQKAALIFKRLKQKALHAPAGDDSALVFRDAARFENNRHQLNLAQEDYHDAMVKSGITSIYPANNATYTRLTRNTPMDGWLKKGIRADAALLYRQNDTNATVDEDFWRLMGTAGTSEFRAHETIIQANTPLFTGRMFLRTDIVNLSAGDFLPENGVFFTNFGTCTQGCQSGFAQTTKGIGANVGWQDDHWNLDIGHTPIGFPVPNWLGGINYASKLGPLDWALTVSQRSIINSLLSYSGTIDPNTGLPWGGVVASGLNASTSYDKGEANGFWGSLGIAQITGEKVLTNQRVRLMDGVYHKFINEDNQRLALGLMTMLWHYKYNLNGYTLGQGGYYSPQQYFSVAVPLNYRKRTDNWSYELGGSGSWIRARTSDMPLYPLAQIVPPAALAQNTLQTQEPLNGFGYTLLAMVERRLTDHFVGGVIIDLQRSRDYTPSHASLFIRYSLEGWQGDLEFPIVPLIPYADFK
ncbi:MAG: cellulose synthase subunit BcsC-related outer membrane protein [Legionellales bacterium]